MASVTACISDAPATESGYGGRQRAASPAVSRDQPAAPQQTTDGDSCLEENATTEVQQSDDECSSPTDSAPARRLRQSAAVAAGGSLMPPGDPAEGRTGVQRAQPTLGADSPSGTAAGDACSRPSARVADPAVDATDAAAVVLPAVQLSAERSPPHAGGTSEQTDDGAPLGARLPLQLASGDDDETVNITSASPPCNSPGLGSDAVSGDGLRRHHDMNGGKYVGNRLCDDFIAAVETVR